MERSAAVRSAVILGVLAAGGASAQQAATDDGLTATQKLGRQVFAQSCGICHLPPQINARTYGPLLSKETAGGSDEVIHGLISEGTPRMPAFKHYLERAEIDAIIAYLKTGPRRRHAVNGQGETPCKPISCALSRSPRLLSLRAA